MPNTLAHLGIQGLATHSWLRAADPRWIFLGAIIPDVPWIANRLVPILVPWVDPLELRLYAIAQASLLCSLLVCGAIAMLARSPGISFALLAFNALLHLLLDALQTKWGNGVHILAPFSWHTWNVGLFWPESLPTYLLTALGLGYGLWALARPRRDWPLRWPAPRQLAISAALLCAYVLVPLALRSGPERADSHYVRTLRSPDPAGRPVQLDRVWLRSDERGDWLLLDTGQIAAVGQLPGRSARVSVRGRLRDATALEVDAIHVHEGWPRDLASYLGLGLVAALWVRSAALYWRRPRQLA